MQAVIVGVAVLEGVIPRMVRVDVGGIGRIVGVNCFVEVIWTVSFSNEIVGSWIAIEVEMIIGCGRGASPQAIKKIKIILAITRLLNTLAVYHKNLYGC